MSKITAAGRREGRGTRIDGAASVKVVRRASDESSPADAIARFGQAAESLGGMRMRKLSEDTTRASLAASCLIDEIRIDAGGGGAIGGSSPMPPLAYEGDGFAPFNPGANDTEEGTESGATSPVGIGRRIVRRIRASRTRSSTTTSSR